MKRSRITIERVNCRRCGKEISTASRSIYGLDSLKARYGSICHDCTTDDERNEMLNAMATGERIRLDEVYKQRLRKVVMMEGLYQKYIVSKANGTPLDPDFESIVLRIDGGRYLHACRAGVAAFAEAVREHNSRLAEDIQQRLKELAESNQTVTKG